MSSFRRNPSIAQQAKPVAQPEPEIAPKPPTISPLAADAPPPPNVPDVPVQTPKPVVAPIQDALPRRADDEPPAVRELGKGGAKHRYLQSLAKELAEAGGLKATIEAPLATGGQVDVLIERNGILAAIEISVSTPAEHERENLLKCLAADIPRIAIVLAKSKSSQSNYRAILSEVIPAGASDRVAFVTPEELADFIGSLAPVPTPEERIVRGYRVKGSFSATTAEDARAKHEALAKLITKSLSRQRG